MNETTPDSTVADYLLASSYGVVRFIQARHFTPSRRGLGLISLIVIHATDGAEGSKKAEDCAMRFAGLDAPRASAHYAVDSDSAVQCVLDKDVAWHAPGANSNGIGIELCGRARQTRSEWMDSASLPGLLIAAGLTARLCKAYGLPVKFVDRKGLVARPSERGITTHFEVNMAFKRSSHTDPGPGFPMDWYLQQVQTALALI